MCIWISELIGKLGSWQHSSEKNYRCSLLWGKVHSSWECVKCTNNKLRNLDGALTLSAHLKFIFYFYFHWLDSLFLSSGVLDLSFNWRIIALQRCVGFCVRRCECRYISSLMSRPPLSHPCGPHTAPGWAPGVSRPLPTSYLSYTWACVYTSATLSVCPTLSFPLCVKNQQILEDCTLAIHCAGYSDYGIAKRNSM